MRRIDYESEIRRALEENIAEVKQAVLSRDNAMSLKIRNYAERFDLPIKVVEHKILKDSLFANQFAKDPSKQSIHQKVAAGFIESITEVVNFMQLPAGGSGAKYICNDGIVRTGSNASHGTTKSIDFYWEYGDCAYYAAHKHTTDEGGAQDNQFHDLTEFLINASKSKVANTFFIAIGDGKYYQRKYSEDGEVFATRLEFLNKKYGTKYARALTTDELESFMVEHSGNKVFSSS